MDNKIAVSLFFEVILSPKIKNQEVRWNELSYSDYRFGTKN